MGKSNTPPSPTILQLQNEFNAKLEPWGATAQLYTGVVGGDDEIGMHLTVSYPTRMVLTNLDKIDMRVIIEKYYQKVLRIIHKPDTIYSFNNGQHKEITFVFEEKESK